MLATLPDIIVAVVIILVLAASMSTLSSLVLTSASTLTLDVVLPALSRKNRQVSQKKQLVILRAFVIFFVAISAAIAIIKDSYPEFTFIAQMMGISWGALAGAFIAPFLYGLYSRKITVASCWVSFIFGCGIEIIQLFQMWNVITFSNPFLAFVFTNSLYSGVFAMVGGLILVPLVSIFTPKCDKDMTDRIFACYDCEVVVPVTEALGK